MKTATATTQASTETWALFLTAHSLLVGAMESRLKDAGLPPLAWYDRNNGEIGDICNGQQGTTVGGDGVTYVIQLEFSNAANNCVAR